MATTSEPPHPPSAPGYSPNLTKRRSLSPTPSSHSNSSASSTGAGADTAVTHSTSNKSRNFSASQAAAASAAIAAAVDATCSHRTYLPGLAELFFAPGGAGTVGVGVVPVPFIGSGGGSDPDITSSTSGVGKSDKVNLTGSMGIPSSGEVGGHPSLPSVDAVTNAAKKSINDCPPFVTMSVRDSAPQLKLEDPPLVPSSEIFEEKINLQRKLVVRGGMKGYRMSRATHGVTKGCYYYEAVIMGTSSDDASAKDGSKRPSNTTSEGDQSASKRQKTGACSFSGKVNGHLRIGWCSRLGDLQAPVGYDKYSYAIRDISGSRIHCSRREDLWGGQEFGPGDVIGFAISLDGESAKPEVESSSANQTSENNKNDPSMTASNNCIYFFKNGDLLGKMDGKAFDQVTPDTYFPAISCYEESAARLNFGPHFIYPPTGLPIRMEAHPVSDLCPPPPTPDDAVDMVLSGSKEGKKIFFSKRTDENIVSVFKELVKAEASVRHEAYQQHLRLHLNEIRALREERGLDTFDVVECEDEPTDGAL